jgi:ubiquinone biosynthesis protein
MSASYFSILRRYREIISILIKFGFEDILADAGVSVKAKIMEALLPKSLVSEIHAHNKWERIRMASEELGTTFIKFAQILSNRPDVIPMELVSEFEKLQNKVPPFSSEEARKIIEQEIGKPIEEVFGSFEDFPFASASIAQVHKAKLKDGTKVVIKVRRPNIEAKIELDITIMKYIARKLEERDIMASMDLPGIVRAFESAIHKEVDLTHEGYNLQRFANYFETSEKVYVPKYFPELTTQKMLTMEYIDGIHPYDFEGIERIGDDRKVLARNGLEASFQQIFEFGFFHADPHPGNLFALPGNKICFIDFGMMGTVLKADIEFFADIVFGVTNKDAKTLIWGIKNLAVSQQFDGVKAFEYEVEELIQDYHAMPLGKINMAVLFNRLLEFINRYKIRMPADYFLLSKAIMTIEGVGHRLDPDMDIITEMTPFINKSIAGELNLKAILSRLITSTRDSISLIENLPRDLREIIIKIKKGDIKVAIEHEGLDDITRKIDLASSRIAVGFIIGSIMMSSAILIAVHFPPLVNHWSIPGIVGFSIATVFGLRVLYQSLKN